MALELELLEETEELSLLLEEELELVRFLRPFCRMFLSLSRMFLPSGRSCWRAGRAFRIFSAAKGPTWTSTSSLSMAGPSARDETGTLSRLLDICLSDICLASDMSDII